MLVGPHVARGPDVAQACSRLKKYFTEEGVGDRKIHLCFFANFMADSSFGHTFLTVTRAIKSLRQIFLIFIICYEVIKVTKEAKKDKRLFFCLLQPKSQH